MGVRALTFPSYGFSIISIAISSQKNDRIREIGANVLEDTYDLGFSTVKDKIINLVVAMNQGSPVWWLSGGVFEERYHLLKMRDFANGNPGIDIDSFCLRCGNSGKGFDLPIVKASRFPKIRQPNRTGIDPMKFCKCQ